MPLLDTTVFLDLQGRAGKKCQLQAQTAVNRLLAAQLKLTTSRINVAELYVGIELSRDPVGEELAIQAALTGLQILEFDDPAAQHFARIRANLQKRGLLVGDMDMLIAAIALTNNEPLVTRNPSHFTNIPGLQIIQYG